MLLGAAGLSGLARGAVFLTGPWTAAYFSPVTRCDAILVGCALGMAIAKGWQLPRSRVLTGAAVATLAVAFWLPGLGSAILIIPVASVGSAVLVARLLELGRTPLHVLLSTRPLRFCGRVSYGMYLWHPIVLSGVVASGIPFTFLTTTAASTALATSSWVFVERPWLTTFSSRSERTKTSRARRAEVISEPSTTGATAQVRHVG
jgi:peptidoglycan/LPS O-acetylase OafA/YrhL